MKEYDTVELIRDRAQYKKAGVIKGDQGIILGGERCGYFLVYFYKDKYIEDGIELYHEIDVGVREEDLKVIHEDDPDND